MLPCATLVLDEHRAEAAATTAIIVTCAAPPRKSEKATTPCPSLSGARPGGGQKCEYCTDNSAIPPGMSSCPRDARHDGNIYQGTPASLVSRGKERTTHCMSIRAIQNPARRSSRLTACSRNSGTALAGLHFPRDSQSGPKSSSSAGLSSGMVETRCVRLMKCL